jgi:hypothetical protein
VKSLEFRRLIQWIANEISILGSMDERISQIEEEHVNNFLIELSGFLKELMCPYEVLVHSHANNKMLTVETRYLLLEYLISELMSVKMFMAMNPKDEKNVITLHESSTASALKDIAITLNLGKPPDNISPKVLFEKINTRLNETLRTIPQGEKRLGKPLFVPKKPLTDDQWKKLERIHHELDTEYDLRRKMLLTRLNCTVQSFKWSDKIKTDKNKDKEITERFSNKYQMLDKMATGGPNTDIAALLAARDTLAIIEKTSSASVRRNTKCKIQRHIIGKVPDRGGRAYEHQIPPPEMPSWQQRKAGPQGGGYQGGRGGYQQNQNRGGYQQNRGNYHQQGGYDTGRGGGGGGNYQQQNYQHQPQNYNQQGGYDNHNQPNYRGGGRVQGGWSQKGGHSYDQQQSYRGGGGGYRGGRR